MNKPLLIVDDNEGVFESLEMNFQREGRPCLWAANGSQAVGLAAENDLYAALIDFSLGSESGLEAMRRILEVKPGLPIVFISGYGTLEAAVQAVKTGAYDFLPKPLNFRKLLTVLTEAAGPAGSGTRKPDSASPPPSRIVAAPAGRITELLRQADRVAGSGMPVLIAGESGSGKELLAEYLHARSERRRRPLVRINCSAISDTLAESELFGHVKGAFTGAVTDHKGYFEQAAGGTVHLDEIGDMTAATQARVLRVIEDRRIRRVGGTGEIGVSVRIVASTNKDLAAMSAAGAFRLDLYYRLNAVELRVPPLRERPEDILPLLEHFAAEAAADGSRPGKRFSPKAVEAMRTYSWPGNVREFRNVVKACLLLNPGDVVDYEHLPRSIRVNAGAATGRLEDAEREAIMKALDDAEGDKKTAARRLGISLRTLYNKLERYGM